MSTLYDDVPGQPQAVAALLAAAAHPVHAYLLVGPPGTGKRAAALRFAASLLAPGLVDRWAPDDRTGGPGAGTHAEDREVLRRVLAGVHPDVMVVE
ncbi:MAG: ATP-binding protein, partial [Acidimicrobiaceae bacterium]|nr:ATP-binding protein [Acidimicrobiaceae bacterium]